MLDMSGTHVLSPSPSPRAVGPITGAIILVSLMPPNRSDRWLGGRNTNP